MSKPDGGPAFPAEHSKFVQEGDSAYQPKTRVYHFQQGMSLRQYYKGQIMHGYRPGKLITDQEIREDIRSYCRAVDAMLDEDDFFESIPKPKERP